YQTHRFADSTVRFWDGDEPSLPGLTPSHIKNGALDTVLNLTDLTDPETPLDLLTGSGARMADGMAVRAEANDELMRVSAAAAQDLTGGLPVESESVRILAEEAARLLGSAYAREWLDDEDVQILQLAIQSDPMSFVDEDRFNLTHLQDKVRDLFNVPMPLRPRLLDRLRRRVDVMGPEEAGRIYIEGEPTSHILEDINRFKADVFNREYDYYTQYIVPALPKGTIHVSPIDDDPTYADFGLDWIRAESMDKDKVRRYHTSTVADSSQLPKQLRRVERVLDRFGGGPIAFTSFEPQLRKEDPARLTDGWRQTVFGQMDVKTYARNPNDQTQQAMDIWTVTHLIQTLRSIGIPDSGIRIRMNDHWGIVGRTLEIAGLNLTEIRRLRPLFNALAEARASGDPDRIALAKATLSESLRPLEEAGRLEPLITRFVRRVIDGLPYEETNLTKKYAEIPARIRRLRATKTILKRLYPDTGIKFEIDPAIFINEKDSNLGGQADVRIDGQQYNEVASFAANMSHRRREGIYLTSTAIGMTRLLTILNRHPKDVRWAEPYVFRDVLSEVEFFRTQYPQRKFEQPIPFQRILPGFDPSEPVLNRRGPTPPSGARMAERTTVPRLVGAAGLLPRRASEPDLVGLDLEHRVSAGNKLTLSRIRTDREFAWALPSGSSGARIAVIVSARRKDAGREGPQVRDFAVRADRSRTPLAHIRIDQPFHRIHVSERAEPAVTPSAAEDHKSFEEVVGEVAELIQSGDDRYVVHDVARYWDQSAPDQIKSAADVYVKFLIALAAAVQENRDQNWHIRFTYKGVPLHEAASVQWTEEDRKHFDVARSILTENHAHDESVFPEDAHVIGDLTVSEAKAAALSGDSLSMRGLSGAVISQDEGLRSPDAVLILQLALSSSSPIREGDPTLEFLRHLTRNKSLTAEQANMLREGRVREIAAIGDWKKVSIVKMGARLAKRLSDTALALLQSGRSA
ncbi:MAG: hypothetical protein KBD07_01880, partial [Candidatus Omnitrophica bacterium]|nr:hypothetical protein [Candidatus Omnitrophota bacterium]